MLNLPEDSRASGAAEATSGSRHIAFGFDRHRDNQSQDQENTGEGENGQDFANGEAPAEPERAPVQHHAERRGSMNNKVKTRLFFGDDAEKQLQDLSVNSAHLATELTTLLKMLRLTMQNACAATKEHAHIYHNTVAETGIIGDASLKAAEEIAARTQALAEGLGDLGPLKQRIGELEAALTSYERIADKILQ
mmetsp:Transcript_21729/g.42705  ORF Transcript_21729/g.42705 Transcript_21729/m.42705 type:complete len:193 (+) Transcript_21729:45-623(+)|eukprot:CAMPEP_0171486168 /NCGR_PEP_ID=MMETSP0958-20121227/944_1 /TAXON_ID=87120 /ORGANISM="Aurantiochytrium limacinum, Strain ATCCMYA-1381" /LENGTH=192 /DNA_ID=CAMNT_0012019025 /DNA_START=20 /DNA_END=598 /DNA_ORIENTATION=-